MKKGCMYGEIYFDWLQLKQIIITPDTWNRVLLAQSIQMCHIILLKTDPSHTNVASCINLTLANEYSLSQNLQILHTLHSYKLMLATWWGPGLPGLVLSYCLGGQYMIFT